MIWLTWRHQRLETLIGGGLVAVVAVLLVWSGNWVSSTYGNVGLTACVARNPSLDTCGSQIQSFQTLIAPVVGMLQWLEFLPLVFGVLVAAPFVLELEQGTYRFAWTQSISRRRWLAVRLGLIVTTLTLVALVLSAVMTWWNTPLDRLGSRLDPNHFDFEGIVPVGYALFAGALCLAAGTLLRRTIAAVGVTLAGYLALRLSLGDWFRYHYLAPATKHVVAGSHAGALSHADFFMNSSAIVPKGAMRLCNGGSLAPPLPGTIAAQHLGACLGLHGMVVAIVYQPANRFWLFQGIESAIFLGLSVALVALTAWWVTYRLG